MSAEDRTGVQTPQDQPAAADHGVRAVDEPPQQSRDRAPLEEPLGRLQDPPPPALQEPVPHEPPPPGGGAEHSSSAVPAGPAVTERTQRLTPPAERLGSERAPRPVEPPPAAAGPARTEALSRPERPDRPERPPVRPAPRSEPRRPRHARLVLQRVDPWSVFLFSLVASIALGIVLLVAVATLYAVLSGLGVLSSVNDLLGEVLGSSSDPTASSYITAGRVLGATAVLAAVDVVLLTVLATLGALLYNLCASLTGGVEVDLRQRD